MLDTFEKLSGERHGDAMNLEVYPGRSIKLNNTKNGVAKFHFDELCEKELGSADYIAISRNFHSVLISEIPFINTN